MRLDFHNPLLYLQKYNELFDAVDRRINLDYPNQPSFWQSEKEYTSPAELWRDGDNFTLLVPVPGFSKSDINIETSKNHISISCAKAVDNTLPSKLKLVRGSTCSTLVFKEPIPGSINPDSIQAALENGILTITLSVAPKKELVNKITIK